MAGEKFTLWARLSSLWGAGLATFLSVVAGLMGAEIWQDYKTFRQERVVFERATVETLGQIQQFVATATQKSNNDLRESEASQANAVIIVNTLNNHEGRIIRLETIIDRR